MGQASVLQKQIASGLRDVLDILANRRQHELARLVKKLTEAESELAELGKRQDGLRKKMKEARAETDEARRKRELKRLQREQRTLQEETQQMARRLQRLLADRAGRSAAGAAQEMAAAGQEAAGGNADKAANRADQASKLLEETRQRLAQRRLKAQAELAMEQLGRLQDSVKHLHRRQKKVIEETARLELLKREAGLLSRAQSASLDQLTREEEALRDETAQLAEKLVAAAAFNFALSAAGHEIGRAAALLRRRDTGPTTQLLENSALSKLELLLEAVEPEQADEDGSNNAGGGTGRGGMPPGAVQTLAELKLLKLLQEEINLRTQQFPDDLDPANLSDLQRRQYAILSADQGRLAELLLQLLQSEQNPEDDPDSLPDMRIEPPGPLTPEP